MAKIEYERCQAKQIISEPPRLLSSKPTARSPPESKGQLEDKLKSLAGSQAERQLKGKLESKLGTKLYKKR